jgi:hypothetical protein
MMGLPLGSLYGVATGTPSGMAFVSVETGGGVSLVTTTQSAGQLTATLGPQTKGRGSWNFLMPPPLK